MNSTNLPNPLDHEVTGRPLKIANLPNPLDREVTGRPLKIANPPNLHDQDAIAKETMSTNFTNLPKPFDRETTKETSLYPAELPDHMTTAHVRTEGPVQKMIRVKLEIRRQEHRVGLFTCLRQLIETQAKHALLRNLPTDMKPRMGCSGGSYCTTEHSTIWTLSTCVTTHLATARLKKISRAQDQEKEWASIKNFLKGKIDNLSLTECHRIAKLA